MTHSCVEIDLKEKEMTMKEADRKNTEINKLENEREHLQLECDQYNDDLKSLHEEYNKVQVINEQLSSITASKTKVETE